METKRADTSKANAQWTRFALHVNDWHGPRVAFEPTTHQITRNFHAVRSLQFTNDEKTKIVHRNTVNMPDGKVVHRGPWEITPESVMADGLLHPADESTRSFFQRNGAYIFTYPMSGEVTKFVCEVGSFLSPEYRFTNGFTYENGKLTVISLWREHSQSEPKAPFWSTDNQMKDDWQVSFSDQDATGEERTVKSNLDEEVNPNCSWDREYWTSGQGKENNLYFLPENVTLSCPTDISDGRDFHLAVCWVNDGEQQRMIREHTVHYCNGRFSSFKQGNYRQDKP